jgi:MYXO-CTERM domain-containing protein
MPNEGSHYQVVMADQHRPELCGQLGSCNHGFQMAVPPHYLDGKAHSVRVMAVDTNGDHNALLDGAVQSFACGSGQPGQPEQTPAPGPDQNSGATSPSQTPDDPGDPSNTLTEDQGYSINGVGCSMSGQGQAATLWFWAVFALTLGLRRRGRRK